MDRTASLPDIPCFTGEKGIFNSRDCRDKAPFGAVTAGTVLFFRLHPALSLGVTGAVLRVYREFADVREDVRLFDAGEEDGQHIFRCRYTAPDAGELIWYHFSLEYEGNITRVLDRQGFCDNRELCPWQLTVYQNDRPWPTWYGEGISYQIFPDRFHRSFIPDGSEMIGKRIVHANWDDAPFFSPRAEAPHWCYDYFGGNLAGITEKLPYLASLSVRTLYLCPIFESSSNHRYNTCDYRRIDPMLGDEEDFQALCREAKSYGIRVMIDGVFNHTSNDSRYFNADGWYDDVGAAQSKDSPYYEWYHFRHWPDEYDGWWGIDTMPNMEELHPTYSAMIADGEDSVVRHWLRAGASAWRLDVADELPDRFIEKIRDAMEDVDPDSFLLGEVWEDGTNKIAYSERRRYFLGTEFHSLMNYPFRRAALRYLLGGDAEIFYEQMETVRENYPPEAFYNLMNFFSTHDTPRMLTLLGVGEGEIPDSREERSSYRLSPAQRELAEARLRVGAALLYCFPGSPMLYYGDEAGMEGFEDPFNRGTYPWGREDEKLLRFYRTLGVLRMERKSLQKGALRYLMAAGNLLIFERVLDDERTICALNAGEGERFVALPFAGALAKDALSSQQFLVRNGMLELTLPGMSGMVLV